MRDLNSRICRDQMPARQDLRKVVIKRVQDCQHHARRMDGLLVSINSVSFPSGN